MQYIFSFAAFLLYIMMEGFVRLVVLFYHRSEFIFFGVSALPSSVWTIIVLMGTLINSWLVAMLVMSINSAEPEKHGYFIFGIITLWKIFELASTYTTEPWWYLISTTIAAIIGCVTAIYFKTGRSPKH